MGCLDCIKVFYWMNLKNYNALIKYIPNTVLKCQMLQKDNRVIIFFVCLLCMIYQISYLIVVGNWMNHSSKRPTTYSIFYVCFFLIRHLLVDIYLINVTWFFRSILYSLFSEICMYLCIFEVKLRRRYTIHGRCSYFESTREKKFLNFRVFVLEQSTNALVMLLQTTALILLHHHQHISKDHIGKF